MLELRSLAIPDVKVIRTDRFSDARGYFCETFQQSAFAEKGILIPFRRDSRMGSVPCSPRPSSCTRSTKSTPPAMTAASIGLIPH
ncbi:hypothetical protein ABIB75_005267 [Bradyrhizobium sp. GM2.2]